jgi:hypothetical protein
MFKHIYKALQGNNLSWICFQWGLPNFSTTFFETEERIEISNRFNTFNDSPAVMPINMMVKLSVFVVVSDWLVVLLLVLL